MKDLKGKELSSQKMTAQWVNKLPEPSGMEGNGSVIVLSDDEDSNPGVSTPGISTPGTPGTPAAADSKFYVHPGTDAQILYSIFHVEIC